MTAIRIMQATCDLLDITHCPQASQRQCHPWTLYKYTGPVQNVYMYALFWRESSIGKPKSKQLANKQKH